MSPRFIVRLVQNIVSYVCSMHIYVIRKRMPISLVGVYLRNTTDSSCYFSSMCIMLSMCSYFSSFLLYYSPPELTEFVLWPRCALWRLAIAKTTPTTPGNPAIFQGRLNPQPLWRCTCTTLHSSSMYQPPWAGLKPVLLQYRYLTNRSINKKRVGPGVMVMIPFAWSGHFTYL